MQPVIYVTVWDTEQSCNQSATSPFGTRGCPATKHLRQRLGHRAVLQPVSHVLVLDTGQSCNQLAMSWFGTQDSPATSQPRPGLEHRAVLQPSTYISFWDTEQSCNHTVSYVVVWDTGQSCNQAPTSAFGTQGSYATKHQHQPLGHRAVMQPCTHVSLWDTGQSCNHSQLHHRLFHIQCIIASFALRGLGINFAVVVLSKGVYPAVVARCALLYIVYSQRVYLAAFRHT